jgi:hypothetical protein
MTCDHCKRPIEKGAAYSVTEYGRLHSECLRSAAFNRVVLGPGKGAGEWDPIYVRERAEVRP